MIFPPMLFTTVFTKVALTSIVHVFPKKNFHRPWAYQCLYSHSPKKPEVIGVL